MKKVFIILFFFLILIIFSSLITAIRINEVEINPEEGKFGVEWVEIYNDEDDDVDITGYMIYDGVKNEQKRYTFTNEKILEEGDYIVVDFINPVFNNDGDFILLYDSDNELVDKTEIFQDTTSSEDTWQYCGKNWELKKETKRKSNKCEEEVKKEKQDKEVLENEIDDEEKEFVEVVKEPITFSTISLDSKDIKTDSSNSSLGKNLALYGLIGFLILIVVLFTLNKKKHHKNEFE